MIYHRVTIMERAWQLLDNGKSSNIAREDVVDALCNALNNQVSALGKTRNKQDSEIKTLVIRATYQALNEMDLTDAEIGKIEVSLKRLMK